jgi:adenylate cyclase
MYEIERKFLVDTEKWKPTSDGKKIKQGYLSVDQERTVRIRIVGDGAYITIKGKSEGIKRVEIEYNIPVFEAVELMKLCLDFPVEKTRYLEEKSDLIWEIDIFEDKNKGLVLAEVELEHEDQQVDLPDWIEKEVSEDFRYFNSWLSQHPFSEW